MISQTHYHLAAILLIVAAIAGVRACTKAGQKPELNAPRP